MSGLTVNTRAELCSPIALKFHRRAFWSACTQNCAGLPLRLCTLFGLLLPASWGSTSWIFSTGWIRRSAWCEVDAFWMPIYRSNRLRNMLGCQLRIRVGYRRFRRPKFVVRMTMSNQQNILDNSWYRAREGFGVLEGMLDPASIELNQSQSGIYIDTGLGSAANTVIPANAGIQGTLQNVLSWTPA